MCKPKGLDLQKVVFCTAVPQFNEGKRDRHNTFNTALTAHGVTILKGHHVFDETAQKHSEKQSDINVALSLILDGIDDIYDWAFLVSADSDQAATARVFSERLPNKKLVGVAPPNRRVPDKASPYFAASFVLSRDQIEEAIMPAFVPTKSGALLRRPNDYAPPAGWMHPDDRPKKKRA